MYHHYDCLYWSSWCYCKRQPGVAAAAVPIATGGGRCVVVEAGVGTAGSTSHLCTGSFALAGLLPRTLSISVIMAGVSFDTYCKKETKNENIILFGF